MHKGRVPQGHGLLSAGQKNIYVPCPELHLLGDLTALKQFQRRAIAIALLFAQSDRFHPKEAGAKLAFPVVIVKEGDKFRYCVDYRQLNRTTIPECYPMQRADTVFASLGGMKLFSALDAARGYHQTPVAKEDQSFEALLRSPAIVARVATSLNIRYQQLQNSPARRIPMINSITPSSLTWVDMGSTDYRSYALDDGTGMVKRAVLSVPLSEIEDKTSEIAFVVTEKGANAKIQLWCRSPGSPNGQSPYSGLGALLAFLMPRRKCGHSSNLESRRNCLNVKMLPRSRLPDTLESQGPHSGLMHWSPPPAWRRCHKRH